MTETSRDGQQATAFQFRQAGPRGSAARYLHPAAEALFPPIRPGMRVLDVGCGNGYWAGWFLDQGCQVVGIDPSASGIALARTAHPSGRFEEAVVSTDTLQQLGEAPFDLVVSFEVVEHVYSPKTWAIGCLSSLKPGGALVCSTPYHGYLKNVLIALTGKWDHHHQPMNEGGHIKFWSFATLDKQLRQVGFEPARFRGAGRFPGLWKSMVLATRRPVQ
ncbi:MAG: class I SAM-dependent methyltransferase [Planctomycetaceae bacterium]